MSGIDRMAEIKLQNFCRAVRSFLSVVGTIGSIEILDRRGSLTV